MRTIANKATAFAAKAGAGLYLAAAGAGTAFAQLGEGVNSFGNIAENAGLQSGQEGSGLINTLGSLLNTVLFLLAFVAVLIIIYAGIELIISRGNEEKLKSARKTLVYAALGFALIMLSFQIVDFIINIFSPNSDVENLVN